MDSFWERLALSIGRGEALEVDCATHVFSSRPNSTSIFPSGQVRHGTLSLRKLNGPMAPKHPTQQKTNTTTPTTHKQVTTYISIMTFFYDFLTTFTNAYHYPHSPLLFFFLLSLVSSSSLPLAISILISSAPHFDTTQIQAKNLPVLYPMIMFKRKYLLPRIKEY